MPALLLPVVAMIAAQMVGPVSLTAPAPTACKASGLVQTSSAAPPGLKRLGDLPDGQLTRAVIIRAGPCSLEIVRAPAGFEGGTWRYEVDGGAAAWRTMPAGDR